jgi:hypothetical protein
VQVPQKAWVPVMCRSVAAGTACPYGSKCRFRHPIVSAPQAKKFDLSSFVVKHKPVSMATGAWKQYDIQPPPISPLSPHLLDNKGWVTVENKKKNKY